MREHEDSVRKLAEALLEKETLDIIDIIEVLGQRPFPMGDSLSDYLKEIEFRKEEAKKRKEDEEKKKIEEEEKKAKEEEEKKLKDAETAEGKTKENEILINTEEKAIGEVKEENKKE